MRFSLGLLASTAVLSNALAIDCPGADTAGTPCTSGVFVLAARGTDDNSTLPFQSGPHYTDQGGQEDVAAALVRKAGGYCRSLPYAAAEISNFTPSMSYGTGQGQRIIKEYVDRCKSTENPPRIVILGYSQGAMVMGQILLGGQGWPLLKGYEQYITGGAFFASLSFLANYSIDAGNSTSSGAFAPSPLVYDYFDATYKDRIRSYCQAGDQWCASGGRTGDAIIIHDNAIAHFKQDAIDFLLPLV